MSIYIIYVNVSLPKRGYDPVTCHLLALFFSVWLIRMPNPRIYSSAKDIIGSKILCVAWCLAGFITAIPGS